MNLTTLARLDGLKLETTISDWPTWPLGYYITVQAHGALSPIMVNGPFTAVDEARMQALGYQALDMRARLYQRWYNKKLRLERLEELPLEAT